MNYAAILGLGTAVPEHFIQQRDAAEQIGHFCELNEAQLQRLHQVHQQAGVATRHSVVLQSSTNGQSARQVFYEQASRMGGSPGPTTATRMQWYEQHAGPLVTTAAQRALDDADVRAAEVTHLITVSCSGFAAPGPDYTLINELNLPRGVQRTHVGFMGCHGAINAMRVAKAFCEADPRACVLVAAVELCTLHLQYGFEMQGVVSNSLFADGAAAAVCRCETTSTRPRIASSGAYYLENSKPAMGWRIGDHGFQMTLARSVPRLIRENLRTWMSDWLTSCNTSIDEVAHWAVHPGGPRILEACREALNLPEDALNASEQVLADYGNMSSPTILFVLERLLGTDARPPIVVLGFGPGLAIEALLLNN